jgi:hypothetical protein
MVRDSAAYSSMQNTFVRWTAMATKLEGCAPPWYNAKQPREKQRRSEFFSSANVVRERWSCSTWRHMNSVHIFIASWRCCSLAICVIVGIVVTHDQKSINCLILIVSSDISKFAGGLIVAMINADRAYMLFVASQNSEIAPIGCLRCLGFFPNRTHHGPFRCHFTASLRSQ